jgi:hypothetical protein
VVYWPYDCVSRFWRGGGDEGGDILRERSRGEGGVDLYCSASLEQEGKERTEVGTSRHAGPEIRTTATADFPGGVERA